MCVSEFFIMTHQPSMCLYHLRIVTDQCFTVTDQPLKYIPYLLTVTGRPLTCAHQLLTRAHHRPMCALRFLTCIHRTLTSHGKLFFCIETGKTKSDKQKRNILRCLSLQVSPLS